MGGDAGPRRRAAEAPPPTRAAGLKTRNVISPAAATMSTMAEYKMTPRRGLVLETCASVIAKTSLFS